MFEPGALTHRRLKLHRQQRQSLLFGVGRMHLGDAEFGDSARGHHERERPGGGGGELGEHWLGDEYLCRDVGEHRNVKVQRDRVHRL